MRARVSWPFIWLTMGLLVLLGLAMFLAPQEDTGIPLSPTSTSPQGSRALAHVLNQHGVHVDEAHDLNTLRNAIGRGPSTVLLADPGDISDQELDGVLHAAKTNRVVVVEPSDAARRRLFTNPGASRKGLVSPQDANATRIAINHATLLTNSAIAKGNNAELAISALGRNSQLVWASDWQGQQQSAQGLAWPAWKSPLIWALGISVLLLIVNRGHRFGRLATEPLPVVVQAVESTKSLGVLYRRNKARESAAAALQDGTRARLARHLGLPRGSRSHMDVVASLKRVHTAEAEALLAPVPRSDQELIQLAQQLAKLEKEIIRD